jgi:hypothetical protein
MHFGDRFAGDPACWRSAKPASGPNIAIDGARWCHLLVK